MSIFGIILLSLLIGVLFFAIGMMCYSFSDEDIFFILSPIIAFVIFIASIFIGIGMNTEAERVWLAKFEAEKTTIEQSLDSEVLSGLERVQLVNHASKLNGELAERKANSELWHHVYYDKNIYKDVELIVIK